jgi:hypothetical protein
MLIELDEFIQFLVDHISDDRVRLSKKMKYGFRYYYLTFFIDDEPEDPKSSQSIRFGYSSVDIIFDNRNLCIEVHEHRKDKQFVIEDSDLLNKWNPILEDIVNINIGDKIRTLMEDSLSACYRKDLHREYKMKFLGIDEEEDSDL